MTMTPSLSPDVISAENNAARDFIADNPNPGFGTPTETAPPPAANDDTAPAERQLTPREQIAENMKARRRGEHDETGEMIQNDMGEYVPPFIAKQEAEAAAAREAEEAAANAAKAKDAEPKSYTLKVRGNDIPVASRDELAKLAEIEDDEASEFTDAQLIRLAQKQIAANQILDEAKAAKKTARTSPREDEGHTQPEPEGDEDDDDDDVQPAPHQGKPNTKALIEKIQFGDPEEAAEAFAQAVSEGVRDAVQGEQFARRVKNVEGIIAKANREFEAANQDLVSDPLYADITYNKAVVAVLKHDLISQGLAKENVDEVVGKDIGSAMQAYRTIAADGRVKVRAPHQLFATAAAQVRAKLNLPAPANANAPKPASAITPQRPIAPAPARNSRLDMKRSLAPQPTRASVPVSTAAPKSGDTPAARSNVVAQMRKLRGQG